MCYNPPSPTFSKEPVLRIIAWDLETSNLNADFGIILCGGFKTVGEGKPQVFSIADFPRYAKDPTNDKDLCKALSAELLKADCWLTWFGTYFDIPYLNSRLLYHKLPTLPGNFPHIDGWKTAKNRLKLRNNRLVTVQDFLQLEDEKTSIKAEQWIKALAGNQRALSYITDHCRRDVLVLEEAYERLRPLILDHPNHNLVLGDGHCPSCGSTRLQKRGVHVARTRSFQRFHCQECGSWSKGAKPLKVVSLA